MTRPRVTSGPRFLEFGGIGSGPHRGGALFATNFVCTNLVQRVGFNPLPELLITREKRAPFIERCTVGEP